MDSSVISAFTRLLLFTLELTSSESDHIPHPFPSFCIKEVFPLNRISLYTLSEKKPMGNNFAASF